MIGRNSKGNRPTNLHRPARHSPRDPAPSADRFDARTRSRVMASVKGSRNRSTEARFRAELVRQGIRGWRLNDASVIGKPDVSFPDRRVVVFLDGCFWHGCMVCGGLRPVANAAFWARKIAANKKRDSEVSRALRADGWLVIRFWGHQIKSDLLACIDRLEAQLG